MPLLRATATSGLDYKCFRYKQEIKGKQKNTISFMNNFFQLYKIFSNFTVKSCSKSVPSFRSAMAYSNGNHLEDRMKDRIIWVDCEVLLAAVTVSHCLACVYFLIL